MKTKMFFVAAAVALVSLSSCKKDYTCECSSDGFSYTYVMTDSKKSAAAAACEGKGIGGIEDEEGNEVEGGADTGCTLK